MENKKYGCWNVLSENKIYKNNKVYLSCKCDCGTERDVIIKNLKSGVSKNCGCLRNKKTSERNFKHGRRFTRTWRIWQAMKNRCGNPKATGYLLYGGRGITVCDEWKNIFKSFYNDVGDAPKDKSIDRIDNDGNYEPRNVKWSTKKEQAGNRRSNRRINGVLISDISIGLGGANSLVAKRIKRGWSIERATTEKTQCK